MQFTKFTLLVAMTLIALLSVISTSEAATKIQFGKKASGKATWFNGKDAADVSLSFLNQTGSSLLYTASSTQISNPFLSFLPSRSHATESSRTRTSTPRTAGTLPPCVSPNSVAASRTPASNVSASLLALAPSLLVSSTTALAAVLDMLICPSVRSQSWHPRARVLSRSSMSS